MILKPPIHIHAIIVTAIRAPDIITVIAKTDGLDRCKDGLPRAVPVLIAVAIQMRVTVTTDWQTLII